MPRAQWRVRLLLEQPEPPPVASWQGPRWAPPSPWVFSPVPRQSMARSSVSTTLRIHMRSPLREVCRLQFPMMRAPLTQPPRPFPRPIPRLLPGRHLQPTRRLTTPRVNPFRIRAIQRIHRSPGRLDSRPSTGPLGPIRPRHLRPTSSTALPRSRHQTIHTWRPTRTIHVRHRLCRRSRRTRQILAGQSDCSGNVLIEWGDADAFREYCETLLYDGSDANTRCAVPVPAAVVRNVPACFARGRGITTARDGPGAVSGHALSRVRRRTPPHRSRLRIRPSTCLAPTTTADACPSGRH